MVAQPRGAHSSLGEVVRTAALAAQPPGQAHLPEAHARRRWPLRALQAGVKETCQGYSKAGHIIRQKAGTAFAGKCALCRQGR